MKTVLFQGDSITDCFRSRDNDNYLGSGYATIVAGTLGLRFPSNYKFINKGVSGDRIVDIYARVKCDIWNLSPDYMSILIGVNDVWHDLKNGNGVEADRYEDMYDKLLAQTVERFPNIKILILEPFVLPTKLPEAPKYDVFRAEVQKRSVIAKKLADKYGFVFVPLQQQFDELAAKTCAEDFLQDGVHPTAAGHTLIAQNWLEGFNKLIK